MAQEKTEAAERKLASVGKLEEENEALKTIIEEVKKVAAQLRAEKVVLTDRVDQLTRKRDELEAYLGGLAKKMYIMLEGIFLRPSGSVKLPHNIDADSYFPSLCRILSEFWAGN